ncbi:hypothetical protein [Parasediminibacterium sp. JCM 36343]|uniref:hypothetical protein n=1 Tax=Parasediminibacterium sp. JCM 36343 TaxID=3374279 RepID=UPI00397E4235
MKYLNCFLLALSVFFIGCSKKNDSIVAPPIVDTIPFTTYTILKGQQYATGYDSTHFVLITTSDLKFIARFDSTAIYNIPRQTDVNKLYGFSDNQASHHAYSARFGWAWAQNALRIYGYTYNDSIRTIQELDTVSINKDINCRIQVDTISKSYLFTLNGKITSMPRTAKTQQAMGYRLYPYFGGQALAPHNVVIKIAE